MSKTTEDLAKLLSATNEQLYDRYINIKLMQNLPKLEAAATTETTFTTDAQGRLVTKDKVTDIVLKAPKAGMKPHIAVQGAFNAEEVVHTITITIYNISENVDTTAYNYAEVELGYMNSGIHVGFIGQIISCYMAKPNPDGELVITLSLAHLTGLYQEGEIALTYSKKLLTTAEFLQETFSQICANVSDTLAEKLDPAQLIAAIPEQWQQRTFFTGNHTTRHFRSIFAIITWVNSLFATYAYGTSYAWGAGGTPIAEETVDEQTKEVTYTAKNPELPPIRLGFNSTSNLTLYGAYTGINPANTKALSVIGSAYLSGYAATVTAPFNPDILPGDVVFIDVKYFKTRVNMEGAPRELLRSFGNLWKVVSCEFTFDTFTVNRMVLTLNNLSNLVSAGA